MEANTQNSRIMTLNPWKLYLTFRRAKIITVEPVVFLYMFSLYLSTSILEQYYLNRYGEEKLKNSSFPWPNGSFCVNATGLDAYANASNSVQAKSSHLYLYGMVPNEALGVLLTLAFGPLSDRFGRRPLMFVVSIGSALSGLATLAIIYFKLNMYYFILVNALIGYTGGILTVCLAYVTDVSSKRWLTFRIGAVEAMIYAGGAVGQGIGGVWLNALHCSFEPLIWLYTCAMAGISVYVFIFLPESSTRRERMENAVKRPRGIKGLLQGFKLFFCSKWTIGWKLWAALIAMCIVVINLVGKSQVIVFFLKNRPLEWNPDTIGIYLATFMVTHMICLLFVLTILVAVRFPDALIALIGLAFSAGMNIFTGFVKSTWQMFLIAVFSAPEAVIVSTLRSISSKLVTDENQGALYSFILACEVLLMAIATALFNGVYSETAKDNLPSGMVFFLMAVLCVIPAPLIVLLLIFRNLPEHTLSPSLLAVDNKLSSPGPETAYQPTETDQLLPAPSSLTAYDRRECIN